MGPTRDLNLFGLDLSKFWDSALLALRQLLYGDEAGVYARFFPHVQIHSQDDFEPQGFGVGQQSASEIAPLSVDAVILPDDLVLIWEERLPSTAEAHLEQALTHVVASQTPFNAEETVWGWRMYSRDDQYLSVRVAITSRDGVRDFVSEVSSKLSAASGKYEVWAMADGRPIILQGFDEDIRRRAYHKKLIDICGVAALTVIFISLLLYLPSTWLSIKATQLETLLAETETRVSEVSKVRSDLVEAQAALSQVGSFFDDSYHYHDWLNAIAATTPDSVYFYRLGFKGGKLTVSGFADNAADYQGRLASSGLVSELLAPTAFAFDSRVDRERFSLVMSLGAQTQ